MKENPCALNRQETFACVLAPSLKSQFGNYLDGGLIIRAWD